MHYLTQCVSSLKTNQDYDDKTGMSEEEKNEKTVIVSTKVEPSTPAHPEPYLMPVGGRETDLAYKLTGHTFKIGREKPCEIIIEDPHVSRVHAEISCSKDNKITIKDLGSTNGVFVNGKKVLEVELKENDKILIGTRAHFKIQLLDAEDFETRQRNFRSANLDELTGLYNRKYFNDVLSREFSSCRRSNEPLSLMMFDIDHFKKINDTYGHLGGDLVLKNIGIILHKNLRLENVACRYGGEEFGVILRGVRGSGAAPIAERVRKAVESEVFTFKDQVIKVTISIGIATLEGTNFDTSEDLIHRADEHLYEAKETGRNRTVVKTAA